MTFSLPKRLRVVAFNHTHAGLVPDVMREAADRIEELEAALLGATANPQEKPRFGVRISRGLVTYMNDEPLLTWEQADEARKQIAEVMDEEGEVERVYTL